MPRAVRETFVAKPSAVAAAVWPGPVVGLAALALYARTLAPGLTWAHSGADGGDLLAAALTGGVPHPTGYPTYQLLLRGALAFYPGEPARGGAWLSAIAMALAAGLLADLARRTLTTAGTVKGRSAAATIGALAWAAAPAVWGQATIAEVYALNALFCVGLGWLAWRWAEGRRRPAGIIGLAEASRGLGVLAASGFVFGLALGNHLTVALLLPGLAAWFWSRARISPRLATGLRRGLPVASVTALAGLAVYAYLPLAAEAMPPVNWGDPGRPGPLLWTMSGRLYAGLAFGLPLAELPARLTGLAGEAGRQFGAAWGALLALIGLWRLDQRDRAWWKTTLLIALAFMLYGIGYNTTDSSVYLLPAWAMAALWIADALHWLFEKAGGRRATAAGAVVLGLILLPGMSVARNWTTHDLRRDREAQAFADDALAAAEPDAVLVSTSDRRTFALWYAIYGLGRRADVAPINANLLGFDWYRRTLAANHPDLPPVVGTAEAWITAVAAERPVYLAEETDLRLPGLAREPAGALVKLRRE